MIGSTVQRGAPVGTPTSTSWWSTTAPRDATSRAAGRRARRRPAAVQPRRGRRDAGGLPVRLRRRLRRRGADRRRRAARPRTCPSCIGALAEADIVIGARFAGEGDYLVRGPRAVGDACCSLGALADAKTKLTDHLAGSGLANRRRSSCSPPHYPAEYLGDTVESLVIATRAGLHGHQVPVADARARGRPASQTPTGGRLSLRRSSRSRSR